MASKELSSSTSFKNVKCIKETSKSLQHQIEAKSKQFLATIFSVKQAQNLFQFLTQNHRTRIARSQIAHKVDCIQEVHLFRSTKHPQLPP